MNLSRLTRNEIENLIPELNLTDDEMVIFTMICKGKSRIEIADKISASVPTIDRRIKSIKGKIGKVQNEQISNGRRRNKDLLQEP